MADSADNTSPVWKYFEKKEIKAKTAKCKLCTKDIAADYGNTSNLRRHIENNYTSQNLKAWKNPIKLKKVIKRKFKLCTKTKDKLNET